MSVGDIEGASNYESAGNEQLPGLDHDPFIIFDETSEEHADLILNYIVAHTERPNFNLEQSLLQAFKLSFRYSAGSPMLQVMHQLRYAVILRTVDGLGEQLVEVSSGLALDEANFHIPANHVYAGDRYMKRTRALWDLFMDVCQHTDDFDSIKPRDQIGERALGDLALYADDMFLSPVDAMGALAIRETGYLTKGRPNKSSDKQRFRSDLREHGVLRGPTGNLEFDVILGEIGIFAKLLEIHDVDFFESDPDLKLDFQALLNLKNVWEESNQARFFPNPET